MKNFWVTSFIASLCIAGALASVSYGQDDFFNDEPAAGAVSPQGDGFSGFDSGSQEPDQQEQELAAAEIERLNQEAAAKTAAGDLNGALTLYEESVRTQPNFTALLERARILYSQEELNDAIASFGAAVQVSATVEDETEVLPAYLEMGQAYLDLEKFNEALQVFTAAQRIKDQSRNPVILYNLGLATTEFALNQQYATPQSRQEQLLQGLDYFDKALRVDPNYADALYERGTTHVLLSEIDKALEDFQLAVRFDPQNTDALAQLGFVSSQRGQVEAGKRKGKSAKIAYDFERSIDALSKWLDLVPAELEVDEDDPDAIRRENVLLYRSAAFIALGNEQQSSAFYQRAIEDADTAIEIDEEKPDAFFQKGLALRMLGDLQGAVDVLSEAVELAPGNPEPLLRRGIIHYRLQDFQLARADFENALRFAPRGVNPRASFWLGLCQQQDSELNKAVINYSNAIRYQPNYINAYLNRGIVHMQQARYDRATRDFNQVLRIDFDHSQARSLRQQASGLSR